MPVTDTLLKINLFSHLDVTRAAHKGEKRGSFLWSLVEEASNNYVHPNVSSNNQNVSLFIKEMWGPVADNSAFSLALTETSTAATSSPLSVRHERTKKALSRKV